MTKQLNKCRGQGYDGANIMRGTYGGIQKLIKISSQIPDMFTVLRT